MRISEVAFADEASEIKIKTLSFPDIPETVIVAAPVNAVPPALSKVQFAPPAAGAAHFRPVEVEESATILQKGLFQAWE